MAKSTFEAPETLENAMENIQEAIAAINEDMPKISNGVAKAGRRARSNFQVIVKNSKAARALVTELTKNKKDK